MRLRLDSQKHSNKAMGKMASPLLITVALWVRSSVPNPMSAWVITGQLKKGLKSSLYKKRFSLDVFTLTKCLFGYYLFY